MLHECVLIKKGSRATIRYGQRELSFADGGPSLDDVLDKMLVDFDDPASRPGHTTQAITLDDRYAMRSWKCDARLRAFFGWPDPAPITRSARTKGDVKPVGWPFVTTVRPEPMKGEAAPKRAVREDERQGPALVRGKMIFSHKTAPELEIEGRGSPIDPDGIAAQRRR